MWWLTDGVFSLSTVPLGPLIGDGGDEEEGLNHLWFGDGLVHLDWL